MIQREGYPNISIKLYEDYTAWLANRYVELGATFTTLTMRDGLTGKNEGLLQFYDNQNIHQKMDGDEIFQISVANSNTSRVLTRIYGCKHLAVSIDSKGDNIITVQLDTIHHIIDLKFSRCFFANAFESIQEMIGAIYEDKELIAPPVNGINAHVPRVPWSSTIHDYFQYTRETGLAVDSDQFVFVWEDILGINMMDYETLIKQEPLIYIIGEPRIIGQYVNELKYPLAYDFVWLTKANQYRKDPIKNATFYAHSFLDKEVTRIVNGDGNNAILISRSGGYAESVYRNGYEEALRISTMSQYDGYASAKSYGNFELTPGTKINFYDVKNQAVTDFYVDEVIHEISNNTSVTNMYMFTNGSQLDVVAPIKVKNELATFNSN